MSRFAVQAIAFYKEHLSGKYAFAGARCTFQSDTCSSYARRQYEDTGIAESTLRTMQRLSRCRAYSISMIDAKTLAWGSGFASILESPIALERMVRRLHDVGERREAIGHVVNSAQLIYQYATGTPSREIADISAREGVEDIAVRPRSAARYASYFSKTAVKYGALAAGAEILALLSFTDTSDYMLHAIAAYCGVRTLMLLKRKRSFHVFAKYGDIKKQ